MNRFLVASFFFVLGALGLCIWVGDIAGGREANDPGGVDLREDVEEPRAEEPSDVSLDPIAPAEPAVGSDGATAERSVEKTSAQIRVRGRLVDSRKEPLAELELKLGPRSRWPGFWPFGKRGKAPGEKTTRSGQDGRFEFFTAPASPGHLLLTGHEWTMAERTNYSASTDDIELGDIECVKTATLSGRVHEAGQGIAKVNVTAYNYGAGFYSKSTKTESDGSFRFEGLHPGSLRLMCSSGQHLAKQMSLELEAGELRTGVAVELTPGRSLTGQVVDDLGRPVAKIQVMAHGTNRRSGDGNEYVQGKASSDTGGFFTLNGLAGETVNINAHGKGYRRYWKNQVPVDGGMHVIQLTRLGSISGVLLSETNEPIAGSQVRVMVDKGHKAGRQLEGHEVQYRLAQESLFLHGRQGGWGGKTDEMGRFRIENVNPGNMRVVATGKHKEAGVGGLVVVPGEETRNVMIRAERGVVVEVTVLDPEKKPVAGARITASRKQKRQGSSPGGLQVQMLQGIVEQSLDAFPFTTLASRATTDEEGHATVWGLEAGSYVFRAEEARWVRAESDPIALPDRGRVRVDLAMLRGGRVEVLSFDTAGEPLGGLPFRIKQKDGKQTRSGKTDAVGKATLGPIAAGTYEAWLERGRGTSPFPMGMWNPSGNALAASRITFQVTADEKTTIRLVKPLLATLSGVLRDSDGPVGNAPIQLRKSVSPGAKRRVAPGYTVQTDAEGRFRFTELEAGAFDVIYRRGYMSYPRRRTVVIAKGSTLQNLELLLHGHAVTVRVRAAGQPVQGVRLMLRDPVAKHASQGYFAGGTAMTDAKGEARFDDLPGGSYTVTANHKSHVTRKVTDVAVPERREVELELVKAGSIRVGVRGQDGGALMSFIIAYRKKGSDKWSKQYGRAGKHELGGLEAGDYEVRARFFAGSRAPAASAWSTIVPVAVEADRRSKVELQVTR